MLTDWYFNIIKIPLFIFPFFLLILQKLCIHKFLQRLQYWLISWSSFKFKARKFEDFNLPGITIEVDKFTSNESLFDSFLVMSDLQDFPFLCNDKERDDSWVLFHLIGKIGIFSEVDSLEETAKVYEKRQVLLS